MTLELPNAKTLLIVALTVLIGLGIGGFFAYKSFAQNDPPAGTILIPSDLLKDYEPAAAEARDAEKIIKTQQERIAKAQPTIEQTLRITLDRAGIKPADWGKYEFDFDLKGFKPRTAAPAAPAK